MKNQCDDFTSQVKFPFMIYFRLYLRCLLHLTGSTVSVILSHPPFKDDNVRFTTVPLKPLFMINIVVDNVVFLGSKMLIHENSFALSFSRNAQKSLL